MSIATTNYAMPRRMEKTTCFRIPKKLDDVLKKISEASGIPVSSIIRHCVLTETAKLAKQYGIDDTAGN